MVIGNQKAGHGTAGQFGLGKGNEPEAKRFETLCEVP
jgi:hypothetical protein